MGILDKFLHKRGIKSVIELEPEERETFKHWEGVLSKGEVTVDSIKQFCENQLKAIELKWRDLDNVKEKNERLIILHTIYSTLLQVITAPAIEKENLEKYLEEQINK